MRDWREGEVLVERGDGVRRGNRETRLSGQPKRAVATRIFPATCKSIRKASSGSVVKFRSRSSLIMYWPWSP